MSKLTLRYWVRHDPLRRVRSIKISRDATIPNLCNSLELRLRVPSRTGVRLYKVPENHPVPIDGEYEDILGGLCMSDLAYCIPLLKVASIFPTLPKNRLHLIVDAAMPLDVVCYIRGGDPQSYPITFGKWGRLEDLKIKTKELWPPFKNVPICDMKLYKILPSNEDELRQILNHRGKGILMPVDQYVEDTYSDVPFSSGPLKIVVEAFQRVPASSFTRLDEGETVQDARQNFLDCRKAAEPSDTVDPVPATLLHPVFGQFIQDVERIRTTRDDHLFTQKLADVMSDPYREKADRVETICELFKSYNIRLTKTETPAFETDCDMSINGHRYVIVDFKNDFRKDPCLQAMDHYLESTRSTAAIMSHSPLPCLVVFVFGPRITLTCAAWNRRPTVELLSTPIAFHAPYHDTENLKFQLLARYMAAFRRATETLRNYYETLQEPILQSVPASHLFPYPTTYTSLVTNTEKNIVYQTQQPDKWIFFGFEGSADMDSEGSPTGDRICIKFTGRYSPEAHAYCASLGFAPTLRGFQQIPGGRFMVVMDDLSSEYIPLFDRPVSGSTEFIIGRKLTQFHEAGFVHGDIRDVNIMVSTSDRTKFKLVDFDWAGKVTNELRYPWFMNTEVWRPTGAVDGERILPAHDRAMLSRIYHAGG